MPFPSTARCEPLREQPLAIRLIEALLAPAGVLGFAYALYLLFCVPA